MSAEMQRLISVPFVTLALQWGRARMSAEIRESRRSVTGRSSFNGAALG